MACRLPEVEVRVAGVIEVADAAGSERPGSHLDSSVVAHLVESIPVDCVSCSETRVTVVERGLRRVQQGVSDLRALVGLDQSDGPGLGVGFPDLTYRRGRRVGQVDVARCDGIGPGGRVNNGSEHDSVEEGQLVAGFVGSPVVGVADCCQLVVGHPVLQHERARTDEVLITCLGVVQLGLSHDPALTA